MNKKKNLEDQLNNKDILISDLKKSNQNPTSRKNLIKILQVEENLIKILQVEKKLIKNVMIIKEKDMPIYLFFCLN